ncbi:MAG: SagB/ThcOx family dehydrogenase [Candidatus Cloacimonetes bacterium]|nr:SagB/ThcOx family dehydrogenase [Candidatus Cloacimonadota bacterium]
MKYYTLILFLCLSAWLCAKTVQETVKEINDLRKEGKHKAAATEVDKFMQEHGENLEWLYASASLHALAGEKKAAFSALDRSLKMGFVESDWLLEDTDFDSLKKERKWKSLLGKIQVKRDSIIANLPQTREKQNPIALPKPSLEGNFSVEETLAQRRSVREYEDQPLTLAEVSQILWAAYGVTKEIAPDRLRGGIKTAPSAGGLYPLEIYLAAWKVTGLDPGYYLYEPHGHILYAVRLGNFKNELYSAGYYQQCINSAPASLVYSAIYSRTTNKYGSRGRERYVCMDLGHSGENVYLQAEAMGFGTVAIGAFNDLQLRTTVLMTREEEPLYIMPFGKKTNLER